MTPLADLPDEIFERTLALLERLTAASSPSGDGAGLAAAARLLAGELEARGLTAEIRAEPGEGGEPLPLLLARGPGRGGVDARGPLLLIGHLDTVLPAARPQREGDRLVATGAIDMKGGLAAFAGALDLLARRGRRPPGDLRLAVVPDEEVGGEISRRVTAARGGEARALWVLEPGEPGPEAGFAAGTETIVTGRRGLFQWRLAARGTAAHSGLHYWDGRSALVAAARWAVAAEGLSLPGPGPTVNAGRLVAGEAGFVGDLAAGAVLLGTERQLNVVPDRAVVEGEARFLSAGEAAQVERRLGELATEVAAATGTSLAFERGASVPPVDPAGPQRAAAERAVALAAARGWRLEVETERGGISFPNFLPDPGRLPVLDGLGPVGGGMHTRAEWVSLESLARRIVLLADLLETEAGDAATSRTPAAAP